MDLFIDTTINLWTVLLKLAVSFALGLFIGAERQMRRRDAGLRTFTLICTGSTGAMLISIWIPQVYPDFLNGDPGRIAAQVLTGVGFLGAGAIARGKGSVQGLTTAACIWQAAVIGLAVGAGLYMGAVLVTLMTLFVLITVDKFEQRLFIGGNNRLLVVKCRTSSPDIHGIKCRIEASDVLVASYTYTIDIAGDESIITFKVTVKAGNLPETLCTNLRSDSTVTLINMME